MQTVMLISYEPVNAQLGNISYVVAIVLVVFLHSMELAGLPLGSCGKLFNFK